MYKIVSEQLSVKNSKLKSEIRTKSQESHKLAVISF